jgi:hypothetical protein
MACTSVARLGSRSHPCCPSHVVRTFSRRPVTRFTLTHTRHGGVSALLPGRARRRSPRRCRPSGDRRLYGPLTEPDSALSKAITQRHAVSRLSTSGFRSSIVPWKRLSSTSGTPSCSAPYWRYASRSHRRSLTDDLRGWWSSVPSREVPRRLETPGCPARVPLGSRQA